MATITPSEKPTGIESDDWPSRQQRVGRYKVWLLQKRLAELSTQVEAAVIEARQLIAWKQSFQPLAVAELTDEDRRILEVNQRARLAEVVQKHCSGVLKAITQHKWAFPFNNPVDTARFPDYPKIITTPMDFSTIRIRQDSGYYRDPKEWWADVMLVFTNAKRYNAPGSDCHLMAQTLQEVSEEKYEKLIAPRLAEEAAATLREEMVLKKRRAELVNAAIGEAMDAQCAVLFNLMAELHAAIREAKLLASSLCEPLTLEEKQALAATIQGLPTAQLESIVAFVASRHPPSVSTAEVQPGAAAAGSGGGSGGGGVPSRKVQLNLGRYDPLLLRQLQHLVSTCTAAQQQAQLQAQGQAPGPVPPLQLPRAKPRQASQSSGAAAAAKAAAQAAAAAGGVPPGAAAGPSGSSGAGQAGPAPGAGAGGPVTVPATAAPQGPTPAAQPNGPQPAGAEVTAAAMAPAAASGASVASPAAPGQGAAGSPAGPDAAAAPGAGSAPPPAQPAAPAQPSGPSPSPPPEVAPAQPPATQQQPVPAAPQQEAGPVPVTQPQPATAPEPGPAGGQAAAPAGQGATVGPTTAAAPAVAASPAPLQPSQPPTPAAPPAASPAAPAPPALGSTQRNISDVVTNATASGVSVRAGIKWPGLVVGAGARPRARVLLSLQLEGPASAPEMLAVCPLPTPAPPQPRGMKRTAAAAALQAEGEPRGGPAAQAPLVQPHAAQAPIALAVNGLGPAGAHQTAHGPGPASAAQAAAAGPGPTPMDVDGQAVVAPTGQVGVP